MAHVPRCLVPDLHADELLLDEPARHHVERVLRLRTGEELLLVDGRGGLARARLAAPGRARIESRDAPQPPEAHAVQLAVAVPRLPRLEWLVEKACELDVTRLLLLETQHGERGLGDARLQRLRRLADEALLQCGRLHRMAVEAPAPLAAVLDRAGDAELWLASPPAGAHATNSAEPSRAPDRAPDRALLVLVGPEGGFTAAEQAAALGRGARCVSLGATVLRVETAALALAVMARAATLARPAGHSPAGGEPHGSLR
ncbi:MAG TPA: RsmE family RNA methyltransferase [Planctomycetota bacterium]|nr:RsmE family RNA methyltransferase [Planctomycetota bacterium]